MPQLIRCFECGKQVSSGASKCPNCGTYSTKGVDCKICGGKLKSSQSVKCYPTGFGHEGCIQKVSIEPKSLEVRCSVCSNSMVYSCEKINEDYKKERLSWHGDNDCSNCGERVVFPSGAKYPYTECSHCDFLLIKNDSVQISSYQYVHDFCYTINSKLQQRKSEYATSLTEVEKRENKIDRLTRKHSFWCDLETLSWEFHELSIWCGLGAFIFLFILKVGFLYSTLIALIIIFSMRFSWSYAFSRKFYFSEEIKRLKEEIKKGRF